MGHTPCEVRLGASFAGSPPRRRRPLERRDDGTRPELEAALSYGDGAKGGRPPFDPVMMFKILVIQAQNNLADDRAEFLINDRLSFMRFLGLGLTDKVPDAKTIWAFRERLTRAEAIEALFARFDLAIREAGYIPMSGQIVDASLVSAPKQRNTDTEKKDVKEGRIPEDWKTIPRSSARRTATRAGRWSSARRASAKTAPGTQTSRSRSSATRPTPASTGGTASSGRWDVTDASRHDGRMLRRGLLDRTNTGTTVWADSAYRSRANEAFMDRHGFRSQVHHRKPQGRPMPPHIRRGNATRSRVRAAIEHVFAQQRGRWRSASAPSASCGRG